MFQVIERRGVLTTVSSAPPKSRKAPLRLAWASLRETCWLVVTTRLDVCTVEPSAPFTFAVVSRLVCASGAV